MSTTTLPRCLLLALAVAVSLGVAACNSSGDDSGDDSSGDDSSGDDGPGTPDAPGATCADLAGSWEYAGTCGDDTCVISQTGCAITQVQCSSGSHSTSGTITGQTFAYAGVSGAGLPATCGGSASGDTMSGTCTVSGLTCSFTGSR